MKKITRRETKKKKEKSRKHHTKNQEFKDFKNITFEEEKDKNPFFEEPKKANKTNTKSSNIINGQNITIKRKVNKKRIALIIFLTIAVCVYLGLSVYHLIKNPTDTVVVNEGSISQEETVAGYIIRDETVVKGENYKNGMVEIKSEGSKVASGDPIFRYYSSGEEDLKKKIADLDIKIQEAIEKNNESIPSSDTRALDAEIENALEQITSTNNISRIKEYKRNISKDITKKAKIAGDLSPAGSYLKKLIDERSSYENELNSGAEYINASRSGIVSYRIDGLEEVLNTNDFSKISKEFLESLNL